MHTLLAQDNLKRFDATSFLLVNSTVHRWLKGKDHNSERSSVRCSAPPPAVPGCPAIAYRHPTEALFGMLRFLRAHADIGTSFTSFIYTKLPTFASRRITARVFCHGAWVKKTSEGVCSVSLACGTLFFGWKDKEDRPNLAPQRQFSWICAEECQESRPSKLLPTHLGAQQATVYPGCFQEKSGLIECIHFVLHGLVFCPETTVCP